jgi:hypothetical protein
VSLSKYVDTIQRYPAGSEHSIIDDKLHGLSSMVKMHPHIWLGGPADMAHMCPTNTDKSTNAPSGTCWSRIEAVKLFTYIHWPIAWAIMHIGDSHRPDGFYSLSSTSVLGMKQHGKQKPSKAKNHKVPARNITLAPNILGVSCPKTKNVIKRIRQVPSG